jgi:hypothetical protein
MLKQSRDQKGRSPAARTLGWALSISLALHLVLTPVAGWLGILAWLFAPSAAEDASEPEQLRSTLYLARRGSGACG